MTWTAATAAKQRARTAERIAARRCVTCNKPVIAGEGRLCDRCKAVAKRAKQRWTATEVGKAWNRDYAAARYADRKARGVCIRCNAPAAPGRMSCATHLEVDKVKTQLWLAKRDARQAVRR